MIYKISETIKSQIKSTPEIAIILGSGMGDFVDKIDIETIIPYGDLEGMPVSTSPSHKGQFVFGKIGCKNVVVMQGRIHLYEGYTPQQIAIPIRVLKLLGAKKIILTNLVGAINKSYNIGDFVLNCDHISSFVPSPLVGKNDDNIGPIFKDMTKTYNVEMRNTIIETAEKIGIPLHQGVYVQTLGPQLETPAEIKMYGLLGADVVGMSSAIDAIVAHHCGLKVAGISYVSNMAAGIEPDEFTNEDISVAINKSGESYFKLIEEVIKVI